MIDRELLPTQPRHWRGFCDPAVQNPSGWWAFVGDSRNLWVEIFCAEVSHHQAHAGEPPASNVCVDAEVKLRRSLKNSFEEQSRVNW